MARRRPRARFAPIGGGAQSRPLTPRQAQRALRRLPDLAKEAAMEVIDETAENVSKGAIARAPFRTGRLKGGIDWRKSNPRNVFAHVGVRASRGGVTRGAVFEGEPQDPFYWKFLEYGTVKMRARPMFRPAALQEEPRHRAQMDQFLGEAADRMAKEA